MFPTLLTIGKFTVTPIGLALFLSLVLGLYAIWRVKNIYDLDPEKTLDLFFWTFIGGYIFARIYFVLFNIEQFDSLLKVISIFKYPGLSFWGGLIGGYITLAVLAYKNKMDFWQIADFAVAPVFLGISITSFGCLFNACQFGLPSNLPIAVVQVGLIEKRFPLQIFESLVFFVFFLKLYKRSLRFHFSGQVAATGLIWLGVLKFIFELFRGDRQLFFGVPQGYIWSFVLIGFGVYVYYKKSRRSFAEDINQAFVLIKDPNRLKLTLLNWVKNWYYLRSREGWVRLRARWRVKAARRFKIIGRWLNIKSTPERLK